jgi:hypothetical protein
MIGRKERRRRQRLDDADMTCPDCGIEPWDQLEGSEWVHEDFYVTDALWEATCPDDQCRDVPGMPGIRMGTFQICIGCFEARLGRRLGRDDFTAPPSLTYDPEARLDGVRPSSRFLDRYWDGKVPEAGGWVELTYDENENLTTVELWDEERS